MIYRKLLKLEFRTGALPVGTRQSPARPHRNPEPPRSDTTEVTMLLARPRARHARRARHAQPPRTAVLFGRLVLAAVSLSTFMAVGAAYFTH